MSEHLQRKYDVWNLIQGGKRMQPDKIKITYRYKKTYTYDAEAWIFGIYPDSTTPVLLASDYLLDDSECPRERQMTTMIELQNELEVVDIFVMINNYESLSDVYNIIGIFDVKDIKVGVQSDDTAFDCNGLDPVIATDATSVTETGFTANWSAATGATGYYLDVSTDIDFGSYVTGYENKDVSNVTTYAISGLTEDSCYFYRLRSYNSDGFTSRNSNVIHQRLDTDESMEGEYLSVVADDYITTFTGAGFKLQYPSDYIVTPKIDLLDLLGVVGQYIEFRCKINQYNQACDIYLLSPWETVSALTGDPWGIRLNASNVSVIKPGFSNTYTLLDRREFAPLTPDNDWHDLYFKLELVTVVGQPTKVDVEITYILDDIEIPVGGGSSASTSIAYGRQFGFGRTVNTITIDNSSTFGIKDIELYSSVYGQIIDNDCTDTFDYDSHVYLTKAIQD